MVYKGCLYIIALILLSCSEGKSQRYITNYDNLPMAPEFPTHLDWLNTSTPLNLASLKGKIVLLDFWTYCCINCHHVFADLKKLEKEYAQELVVIGVHSAKFTTEQETENIREAILRHNIEHPVVNDKDFEIWRSYGVNAWPSFALIDPKGQLIGTTSGEQIYDRIKPFIDELIEEYDKSINREPIRFDLEIASMPRSLLAFPSKMTIDKQNKIIYITDSNHHRIVVSDLMGNVMYVIGSSAMGYNDGNYETAQFNQPQGLALDGDKLYIADTENHAIRVVNLQEKTVKTLVGTGYQARRFNVSGYGTEVALNSPWDLVVYGNEIYVAMAGSHQIWHINKNTKYAQPFVGSGRETIVDDVGTKAALSQPSGIARSGEYLYFADSEVSAVRRIYIPTKKVETLIGEGLFDFGDRDGDFAQARLQHVLGIAVMEPYVYVADTYNNKIKQLNLETKTVRTLAGRREGGYLDGNLNNALFNEPADVEVFENILYIVDTNNNLIRVVDMEKDAVSTLSFSNIERMTNARPPSTAMLNQSLVLSEQTFNNEELVLSFGIGLPEGYQLTENAPNKLIVSTKDAYIDNENEIIYDITSFPISINIKPINPSGVVLIDAYLYYCKKVETQKCYIKELSYEIPWQSQKDSPTMLSLFPSFKHI